MSFFLIASILVAVLAILYVWYHTRGLNSIPQNVSMPLNTDDDKLLIHWYKLNIKHSFDFNIDEKDIACRYLKRLYNIHVDPNLLVVGVGLSLQYAKLTNHMPDIKYGCDEYVSALETREESDISIDNDCIFDLRSTVAKVGEIAIIHSSRLRNILRKNNNYDPTELDAIINSDLDLMAHDSLKEILNFRWEQIIKLNDPNLLNIGTNRGSYAYLRIPNNNISDDITTDIMDGVTAAITSHGARINLLCSNLEFEELMKRWSQHLSNNATVELLSV